MSARTSSAVRISAGKRWPLFAGRRRRLRGGPSADCPWLALFRRLELRFSLIAYAYRPPSHAGKLKRNSVGPDEHASVGPPSHRPGASTSPLLFRGERGRRPGVLGSRRHRRLPVTAPELEPAPARALVLRGDASDRLLGELPGAEEGAAEVRPRAREIDELHLLDEPVHELAVPPRRGLERGSTYSSLRSSAPSLRAACARRCGCEQSRQRRSGGRGGSPSSARSQR
jgi:hypothetical protein